MPTFKLPLSVDVVQAISPWTAFMSPIGKLELIKVTIGQSSEPAVEADVLSDVAGYGKQLGRIGDALVVLLSHFHPTTPLTKVEAATIDDLKEMLQRIADVKEKHKRQAMRPPLHDVASPPSPASEAEDTPMPFTPTPEPAAAPASAIPSSAPVSNRRAARRHAPRHSPK
jgi:hypothetical protein